MPLNTWKTPVKVAHNWLKVIFSVLQNGNRPKISQNLIFFHKKGSLRDFYINDWLQVGIQGNFFLSSNESESFWWRFRTEIEVDKSNSSCIFFQFRQIVVIWKQKWYFVTKIVPVIEKLLKFEAEGREFAKLLRLLEQFISTVKCQNKFWKQNVFYLVPGCLSDLMN